MVAPVCMIVFLVAAICASVIVVGCRSVPGLVIRLISVRRCRSLKSDATIARNASRSYEGTVGGVLLAEGGVDSFSAGEGFERGKLLAQGSAK